MTEIVDFDKEFAFATSAKKTPTKTIHMFGRDWHLLASMNTFTVTRMSGGDTASIGDFVYNAVIPEERQDWSNALAAVVGLDADPLMEFVKRLVEVVGNDDTKSPSTSPSSASKKTSARKSTVGSSSARGALRAT